MLQPSDACVPQLYVLPVTSLIGPFSLGRYDPCTNVTIPLSVNWMRQELPLLIWHSSRGMPRCPAEPQSRQLLSGGRGDLSQAVAEIARSPDVDYSGR